MQTLIENGKRAGVVRGDLEPEDTVAIFAVLGVVVDLPSAPERWRRYLALLLDGARASGQPPLPGSVDHFESLDDVIAVTKHHDRKPHAV